MEDQTDGARNKQTNRQTEENQKALGEKERVEDLAEMKKPRSSGSVLCQRESILDVKSDRGGRWFWLK